MADAQKKTPEQKSKIKRLIVILLIVAFIFAGIVLYDQIYNTPMYDWFGGVLKKGFQRTDNTYQTENLQAYGFIGNKIYTYGSEGLSELTHKTKLKHDTKYSSPVIETDGSYLLIYDNGGLNLSLLRNGKTLFTKSFAQPITKARINRSGYVSVITKELGYKSVCTVYDKKGEEVYYIGAGDSYIVECGVTDNGKNLFLSTSNFSLDGIKSKISAYELDKEDEQVLFESDSTIFTNFAILEQTTLVAIGDDLTVGLSFQGKEKWRYDYNKLPLKTYSTNSSSHVAFVLKDTYDHLVTIDKDGKIKECKPDINEIKNVDISGNRLLVSNAREAALYSTSCAQISSTNINRDITFAKLLNGGKRAAVVYGNSIDIYRIK